jgi:branched-chain amino acid transport system substrate-binding protein
MNRDPALARFDLARNGETMHSHQSSILRSLTATAAVLSVVALAACGSGASHSAADSSGASINSNATTAARGALPSSLKLTAVQDVTGPAAKAGEETVRGMKLALKEVNESKYLGNTALDIEFKDTETKPDLAATVMSQVAAGKPPLVFGPISSNSAVAAAPIAQRSGVSALFTQAGSPGVVIGDHIFRITPTQASLQPLGGNYLKAHGIKDIAILVVSDYPTTVELADLYEKSAMEFGYKVTSRNAVQASQVDVSTVTTKIVDQNPGAVVVLASGAQGPALVKSLQASGFTGHIVGNNSFAGGTLEALGNAGNGIVWPIDFDANANDSSKKFAGLYQAEYGKAPEPFAAEGYDEVWFAARALKKADSLEPDAVRDALAAVGSEGWDGALGAGLKVKDGNMIGQGVLAMWCDGKTVPYTDGAPCTT